MYGRLVAEVAAELAALKKRIGALHAEIRDRFLSRPEVPIVLSLPGMSHRTGPRFLAEVGALERFGSPNALAAYAGLTPTLWQSGPVLGHPLPQPALQPPPPPGALVGGARQSQDARLPALL